MCWMMGRSRRQSLLGGLLIFGCISGGQLCYLICAFAVCSVLCLHGKVANISMIAELLLCGVLLLLIATDH